MKRVGWGLVILFALGAGIAFALPATRYRILAVVTGEPLYNGRPVAFWQAALKDGDTAVRREAAVKQDRFIVQVKKDQFNVIEGHRLNEQPLSREEAEALAAQR